MMTRSPLTQQQLASRLGVTFAALNRWLNGRATPRPAMRLVIARLHRQIVGHPFAQPGVVEHALKRAKKIHDKKRWNWILSDERLLDSLVLEGTHNSNAIEGSTLTHRETEAVIFDRSVLPDKTLAEHLEATNHAAILRDILTQKFRAPVTEALIRTFHARLMQGIRPDAGAYSRHQRAIRGVDIALTHPKDIPEEMTGLIKGWFARGSARPVLERIADFHVSFELIHPFGDGNGRVGRLIMMLQCLEAGYPPALIENSRKAEYYDVLEYAQRKDGRPFVVFLCQTIERTRDFIRHPIALGRTAGIFKKPLNPNYIRRIRKEWG